VNFADIPAPKDDFGLSATKRTIEDAQRKLAQKFDEHVRQFIESVEGRPLDLAWDMPVIAAYGHIYNFPDGDFSYFVWRSPKHGPRVLAYRFNSGFHAEDTTHQLTAEFTLQSAPITREQWPEALKRAISERP
jgi:hypothetical protein